MIKLISMFSLYVVVTLLIVTPAPFAAEHPQDKCPVMAGTIDKSLHVDYQGKRIYFCCSMCPDEFKKDPDKYMKKLQDQGAVLEDAPKAE